MPELRYTLSYESNFETVKMVSKTFVVLCCFLASAFGEGKYTDKYDNFDVKEVLTNEKLFDNYAKCLLDEGRCTPEGKELRDHMQDALETGCDKCTETQMEKSTTVIDFLIKEKLAVWKKLTAKYDPDGVWRKKYEEQAKEKGIEIPKD